MDKRFRRTAMLGGGAAIAVAAAPAAGAQFFTYTLQSARGTVTHEFAGTGVGTHPASTFPFNAVGTINGRHVSTWSFVPRRVGAAPLQREITFNPRTLRTFRAGARKPFDTTLIGAFGPVRSTSSTQISATGGDGVARSCSVTAAQPAGARLSPSEYFLYGARQGAVMRLTVGFVDNELALTGPTQDAACRDALESVDWEEGTETFAKVAASTVTKRRTGTRVTLIVRTTTPLQARDEAGQTVSVGTLTQRSVFVMRLTRIV